jgi:hypothetical protein
MSATTKTCADCGLPLPRSPKQGMGWLRCVNEACPKNGVDIPLDAGRATGESAEREWRCFHCDDVFTRAEDAQEHFGATQGALTGCQVKGHEYGLLGVIREQERELASYREEIDPLTLAMLGMKAEHAEALRCAEEAGYSKGVRDMRVALPPTTNRSDG